jgi:hypothetical protein
MLANKSEALELPSKEMILAIKRSAASRGTIEDMPRRLANQSWRAPRRRRRPRRVRYLEPFLRFR